jgi:integrase
VNNRKHLTADEIDKLISATKGVRYEARDRCLLLLMFRHGLRVSEACGLLLSHVDIESRVLHVARLKNHAPATRRRAARNQGMAGRPRHHEVNRQGFFYKPALQAP